MPAPKKKANQAINGQPEPEQKRTISFRFSDPKYYPALDKFSRKDKRKWSDFVRMQVELALDKLISSEK
jgi:hypothetical protein